MELKFTKMQGCGNDYIYINCFDIKIEAPEALSVMLSDRHFGVGGDGIVLILRSDMADAKMRMFNSDGSEGMMCGNAIRCVAKYLYDNGMVRKTRMEIETLSGNKTLDLTIQNGRVSIVRVNMGRTELSPDKIPARLSEENAVTVPLKIGDAVYVITCVSMGNPHAVVFCENIDRLDLKTIGPLFENHEIFPDRVNVEFVEIEDSNVIKMRVWERGAGETLACGTGACASVAAAVLNGFCDKGKDIRVRLPGGELIVNYTDEAVYMTGDCKKVFDGVVDSTLPQHFGSKKQSNND